MLQRTLLFNFSDTPVDTSMSVVHVPTNVYDGDPKVANDIKWSKGLDNAFKNNYIEDPEISWQYFGSTNGFLRQYPAEAWEGKDPDIYDARMRDWYEQLTFFLEGNKNHSPN